jgi:hypothetical protein
MVVGKLIIQFKNLNQQMLLACDEVNPYGGLVKKLCEDLIQL